MSNRKDESPTKTTRAILVDRKTDDKTQLCEAMSASEEYNTSLNLAVKDVVLRWETQLLTLVASVAASCHSTEDMDIISA
ncbi:uncharacterized protein Bfra_005461 [Botrytis fragariae]|uniref:Uncharacterized protein n=1 Tax=Botrytis fragariae TaxID=1964551 RepID=A0A8H6AV10_9HELO|nr:uncharacterized protein Bfra_005461 [Botrytis fragariae]KAF5873994.1 hypothetical protein Bfra_005461 [Botrytis fragariae]